MPQRTGVRHGRAYSPPLREGRWRDRRGGLYGRPWRSCGFRKPAVERGAARADMKSAPTVPLSVDLMGLGLSPPETWFRFAPGFDSSFRRGRCPHRPARRRVQRTSPTAPVGADYISARNQVGSPSAWQPTRPYGVCVRRGCFRRGGAARAADSRPYGCMGVPFVGD